MYGFEEYMHVSDVLHTNQQAPWTIDSARCDVEEEAVYVEMYGETVELTGKWSFLADGMVGLSADNVKAFPKYDDDPRLIMIAWQGKELIEQGKDNSIDVPDMDQAIEFLKKNNIKMPEWL